MLIFKAEISVAFLKDKKIAKIDEKMVEIMQNFGEIQLFSSNFTHKTTNLQIVNYLSISKNLAGDMRLAFILSKNGKN